MFHGWVGSDLFALGPTDTFFSEKWENDMLRLAIFFLVISLIAGFLGVYPVEALSAQIAWILFVIFLVLFVVSLVFGGLRGSGPPV